MIHTEASLIQVKTRKDSEFSVRRLVVKDREHSQQKVFTLRKYIQKHPSGWKKRLELADLLYSIGCWEQAIVEYNAVLERKKKSLQVLLKLGDIFYMSGSLDQAIETYHRAFFACKDESQKSYITWLIQCCEGKYSDAIEAIKTSIRLSSQNSAQWLSLGLTHLMVDAPLEALHAFQQVLSQKPEDVTALNCSYDVLLMIGDIYSAQVVLDKSLSLAGEHSSILERNISHRLRQRKVNSVEGRSTWELLQKLLENAPDSLRYYDLLAHYYAVRGDWKKGSDILRTFTESHSNQPETWSCLARYLFRAGNYSEAQEYILYSYRLAPNNWEVYRVCYELFPFVERFDDLRDYMEEMLERFPERWSSWAIAGRAFIEHFHDSAKGLAFAERGIQIQPDLADAWFQYGKALAASGDHLRAIGVFKEGWDRLPGSQGTPQSVVAAMWLGESFQSLADVAKSKRWFGLAEAHAQQMMEFHPALGHYWWGKALMALGDFERAKIAYQEALAQQVPYPARGEIQKILGEKITKSLPQPSIQ